MNVSSHFNSSASLRTYFRSLITSILPLQSEVFFFQAKSYAIPDLAAYLIYNFLPNSFHCTILGYDDDVGRFVNPTGKAGSVGFRPEPKMDDAVYQQVKGGGD